MTKFLVVAALSAGIGLPTYALAQQSETGGPSGGPNQAQSVVPSGTTGGKSGGPNQAQAVKKPHSKMKHHHHKM